MMFLVSGGDLQLSSLSLSSVIQEKINYEESNGQKRPAIQLSLEQGDWDQAQTNSPSLRGKGEERQGCRGGGGPSPEQRLEIREEMLKDDGEGREGCLCEHLTRGCVLKDWLWQEAVAPNTKTKEEEPRVSVARFKDSDCQEVIVI